MNGENSGPFKKELTLGEALSLYAEQYTRFKKGARQEFSRIRYWMAHPFSQRPLSSFIPSDWRLYAIERQRHVSPSTIRLELALIRHLFTVASEDWAPPPVNKDEARESAESGSPFRTLRHFPHPGEFDTHQRGDLFGREGSLLKKCPDHLLFFQPGSLLEALLEPLLEPLLESLLKSLLEIFVQPCLDDVLSHSYLPGDGVDNLLHLLGIGDFIDACHIVHLWLRYSMGGLPLPDLSQKKPDEGLDAIENVLEGEKGQHSLEIVHMTTDLFVVDPTKIDEGKNKVGRDRKKL